MKKIKRGKRVKRPTASAREAVLSDRIRAGLKSVTALAKELADLQGNNDEVVVGGMFVDPATAQAMRQIEFEQSVSVSDQLAGHFRVGFAVNTRAIQLAQQGECTPEAVDGLMDDMSAAISGAARRSVEQARIGGH